MSLTPETMLSYFDVKYVYTGTYTPIKAQYGSPLGPDRYAGGYAGSVSAAADPLEQIMGEKKQLLQSKIEMLLAGIEQRRKIKQDNMYRIDLDSCDVNTMIFQLPPYRKYGIDRERLTLERMKKDLEKQRRAEEVNYFRDLSFMQKDLIETAIQYLGEQNKQRILSASEE